MARFKKAGAFLTALVITAVSLFIPTFGAAAEETAILYGGSCKPSNAAEIFAKEDVDGGLIGGAALKAEDFLSIGKGFAK